MRRERAEATHRARAAAWEAEKAEAQANRVSGAHLCKRSACGPDSREEVLASETTVRSGVRQLGSVMMMCAIALSGNNKAPSMSGCLGCREGGGAGE